MTSGLINFGWVREGQVAGMGHPSAGAARALRELGIEAVISLTERELRADVAGDLIVAHVPVVDFAPPTQGQLMACVRFLDAHREEGRGVAVHCMAGIGRTGTVLAAWLVSQGARPEAALIEIRRLRPGSVETEGQIQAIRRFAETLAAQDDDEDDDG